ncbi:response regulator transcription factor [Paenibacillus sp.]|uniref:response regulator transcription factor n=1 Tax=Paenibacillus sp. TaxID=58172 RepID=UPI002D399481|nr:response regulator [Paenibacillus sp.]HZG86028.1 response regulator [Paenibacillus sp.]
MYKVLLVDDDYPVLELLSEAIDWESLGLTLSGCCENGLAALEAAEREAPDILVTDIGMPKMDGLELIRRLRERKSNLRTVILSCHSEFEYAKRAMQLHVQDYIVKDTLHPDDLAAVLQRMAAGLTAERQLDMEQHRLRRIVDRSHNAMRETWIHGFVQQPLLRSEVWQSELEGYGLPMEGRVILPVVAFLDDLRGARGRYVSDDVLRFAVTNVLDEVMEQTGAEAVVFPYSVKEWVLLHSYRPTLSVNGHEEARRLVERMQAELRRALKLTMSFLVGERCISGEAVKHCVRTLLSSHRQRFYMLPGEIAAARPSSSGDGDPFALYDEAIEAFREGVIKRDAEGVKAKAEEWMKAFNDRRYAPESVKDWALKLLLDIRLKHQSLHYFRTTQSADSLHKDVAEIGSLVELKDWLIEHLLSAVASVQETGGRTVRKEVVDAYEYVSLRLDQRIGLEEVAEHLHLNASYFSRLFKRETGETFIEYVIRTKMERAKQLLDETAYPVLKICELLGYDSQSYFIKLFKGYTGMTPMDYRNRGGDAG